MKTAINFNRLTHIILVDGEGRAKFNSVDRTWSEAKSEIQFRENDYLYFKREYDSREEAEEEFARISDKMGLKVI